MITMSTVRTAHEYTFRRPKLSGIMRLMGHNQHFSTDLLAQQSGVDNAMNETHDSKQTPEVLSPYIIGIDLGTTKCCAAVYQNGRGIMIPGAEGRFFTPSVVTFSDAGERTIGFRAKQQAILYPDQTFSPSYCEMGNQKGLSIRGTTYRTQEITAMILRKIKSDAERFFGNGTVTKAVVAVPPLINSRQRQSVQDACTIAGLECLRLISSTLATALAYDLDKEGTQKILVYDLGGGTFDVSLLEIGDGVFEVLATNGNNRLGGNDFNDRIVDWVAGCFRKESGIDLKQDRAAIQRLKEAAENAKIDLSNAMCANINLPFITRDRNGPKHLDMTLTRDKFDALTADLLQSIVNTANGALRDAGLTVGQLDKVILAGGSSRIPAVQTALRKITKQVPFKGINPDECVAIGAAIQCGIFGGEVKDVLLLDATALSLGLETEGHTFTRLIERNTTIPTMKSQVFSTSTDGQTAIDIHILQGESPKAQDNMSLGRFRMSGIASAPRGVPQIEITLYMDRNGIVSLSAKDKGSGKSMNVIITDPFKLSQSEIQQAIDKERKYAAEAERQNNEKLKKSAENPSGKSAMSEEAEDNLAIREEMLGKEDKTERSVSADEHADVVRMLERMVSEESDTSGFNLEKLQESLTVVERHAQMVMRMGATIMPGLCYALSHSDPGVRRKSCWALQILGSSSGLPDKAISFIAKLITDTNERVREQALHSLGVLTSSVKLTAAVPDLITALKSEDRRVRKAAAEVLGKLGTDAALALDPLRLMFDDPDIDASEAAKTAVAKLGGKIEVITTGSSAEMERLARQTTSSEDSVKKNAWTDLERLTNKEAALDPLMKTFRGSGGKAVGKNLPIFLGKVGTEACLAPLLEILEYARCSTDEWEQEYLVGSACLGLLNLKKGVSALRCAVPPELLRFILMHGLMSAGDHERLVVIETLTKDERRIITADVISFFRSAKEKDKSLWKVSGTLKAFGADAIEALLEVFRSVKPSNIQPDGSVSHDDKGEDGAPASALVQIPVGIERLRVLCSAEEYEKILIRAHNYGDAVNPAVNRALGEIATPKAIGRLLTVLWQDHWGEEIRKPAREALIKAGKKAHEQLLYALEIKAPANRKLQTGFRRQVLAVLSETGDEECVPAIKTVFTSDPLVTEDAQAALEAIGKRCGGIALAEVIVPRSLPIKKIAMTGDPYVDNCFQIDFDEFYEERDWFNIPEAKAIADAGNAGLIGEALRLAADFRQEYPDFYFCYYWFAILYRKQKRYDDARKSLMEGLHFAKSKESLCAKMGDVEWEVHDLHEAVKWWIKSIVVQLGSQYATDDDAFLYLSYVAETLGMIGVCLKLRSWVDRLRFGQIRLNAQSANDIYLATSRQETSAMRLAIELLDIYYLNEQKE
ncbi:MAG: molecular chaperone DnaK [Clostridiales bacterium]|nr:molecular chaperone DnaK [Clostridiales bacterium]